MTVSEAIKTRRSVRKYDARPIEDEKLAAVLEAARLSPSASNQQNWRFILVRDRAKLDLLFEASDRQPFMEQAPAALVAVATATRVMLCGEPTAAVDLSIAVSYMILAAHELGLGTCWLGHFFAEQVKAALGIPDTAEVVAMTPIGYPAETPRERPRKTLAEIVSYDQF